MKYFTNGISKSHFIRLHVYGASHRAVYSDHTHPAGVLRIQPMVLQFRNLIHTGFEIPIIYPVGISSPVLSLI